MEPESSLPHSQEPATCPYSEPDQFQVNKIVTKTSVRRKHRSFYGDLIA
jgi:hypothetical protein